MEVVKRLLIFTRAPLACAQVCLFGDTFTVVPEELRLAPPDADTAAPSPLPHASLFLPTALPKGVYADHPVRGGDVRLLVSQYHTLLAQEKGEDLVQLVRALVRQPYTFVCPSLTCVPVCVCACVRLRAIVCVCVRLRVFA